MPSQQIESVEPDPQLIPQEIFKTEETPPATGAEIEATNASSGTATPKTVTTIEAPEETETQDAVTEANQDRLKTKTEATDHQAPTDEASVKSKASVTHREPGGSHQLCPR